jgi:hypothetical protein
VYFRAIFPHVCRTSVPIWSLGRAPSPPDLFRPFYSTPLHSISYALSCLTDVPYLLFFQSLPHSFHHHGGCRGLPFRIPLTYALPSIPFLFILFRTLLHFFALTQNSTLFFSSDSALFRKNTGGWGGLDVPTSKPSNVQMRILHPGRYCGTFQRSNLQTFKRFGVPVAHLLPRLTGCGTPVTSRQSLSFLSQLSVASFQLSTFNLQLSVANFLRFKYRIGTKHYARPAPIGPL